MRRSWTYWRIGWLLGRLGTSALMALSVRYRASQTCHTFSAMLLLHMSLRACSQPEF